MKPVRNVIALAADVTGILAFLGLSVAGIVAWVTAQGGVSWRLVITLLIVGFLLPLALFIILKKIAPQYAQRLFKREYAADKQFTLLPTI